MPTKIVQEVEPRSSGKGSGFYDKTSRKI